MIYFAKMIFHLLIYNLILQIALSEPNNYSFPENFIFGVATASYQIEGGWNEGGRTESTWDYQLHKNPDLIVDKSNGDVACDSYHKWKEDVQLIKNLGVNFYRFSISWSRILPQGFKGSEINQEGVTYYNDLIDELVSKGIEPYVTIFHWDTPQALESQGGWLNESIIDDYTYYARVLFTLYGDRVKTWITFNEFHQICEEGYGLAKKAPFENLTGVADYQCGHQALLAHSRAYRIYEQEFKPIQGGNVGVVIDSVYGAPKTDSELDKNAAELQMQFDFGWFFNPIVYGNYPQVMIDRIDELSKREGYNTSRLPKFSDNEIETMKGSFDFLGLNHYTTNLCTLIGSNNFPNPSHARDCSVETSADPSWKPSAASWLWYVPWGMRDVLVWIKEHYNNPPVLITENGWATRGKRLNDTDRIEYIQNYLSEVLKAIYEDNCNVLGYTAWSLMDNFEWTRGYTEKFGLVHVDFNDPNRTRTPRQSYSFYQEIVRTRRLVNK
ncbi:hypothetical protein HHI36_001068 [Cryptolaemus montrouzieri]|uniref:Beta-glucosidase n=1 Tax=Cryptolaemus montrouzieri TaxID=559131 RepID=A0ABD2P6J9_9CUCU